MKMKLRPWKGNEKLYFYPQSSQISGQTGLIGRLRLDFGKDGDEFFSTWEDCRGYLKTDEFRSEFDEVINSLRVEDDKILGSRNDMDAYLKANEKACLPGDGDWHGFRADTDNYSYMMRMNCEAGSYNAYIYCFRKDHLDTHIKNSEHGIRFITSGYKDLFTIPDGGKVRVTYPGGEQRDETCRYVDSYHLEIGQNGLYHICEYAERCEQNGISVVPLTEPLITVRNVYYCPLTINITERNEYGDLENTGYDYDGRTALEYEEEIRDLIRSEMSCEGCDPRSMASYQDDPKVRSVDFDVKEICGELFGKITVGLAAELTDDEDSVLRDWITGQCSDGFGEGLEQQEIENADGAAYVSFWNSGDDWRLMDPDEMTEYLQQKHDGSMGMM